MTHNPGDLPMNGLRNYDNKPVDLSQFVLQQQSRTKLAGAGTNDSLARNSIAQVTVQGNSQTIQCNSQPLDVQKQQLSHLKFGDQQRLMPTMSIMNANTPVPLSHMMMLDSQLGFPASSNNSGALPRIGFFSNSMLQRYPQQLRQQLGLDHQGRPVILYQTLPQQQYFVNLQQQQQQQQQISTATVGPNGLLEFQGIRFANSAPMPVPPNAAQGNNASSKYRGVSWHKRDRKWLARTWVDGKIEHLSCHKDEKMAALAVDLRTLEHFGDRVKKSLNFPDPVIRQQLITHFKEIGQFKIKTAKDLAQSRLAAKKRRAKHSSKVKSESMGSEPKDSVSSDGGTIRSNFERMTNQGASVTNTASEKAISEPEGSEHGDSRRNDNSAGGSISGRVSLQSMDVKSTVSGISSDSSINVCTKEEPESSEKQGKRRKLS